MNKGYLLLEDSRIWHGKLYGSPPPALGEVVFNTAMTGYQETIYDPSYWGQIVVMTVPHVGNTGMNALDDEARTPSLSGFIARSFEEPSSWRSEATLAQSLIRHSIPALEGVDTRSITRHLRTVGCLRGGIFPGTTPVETAMQSIFAHPSMTGLDGASVVTCKEPYDWTAPNLSEWTPPQDSLPNLSHPLRVALIDYGVKHNILRRLVDVGCEVRVFPAFASVTEIEAWKPHGIMLSNGPGDPAAVVGAVPMIRSFLGRLPIFGICLGHQLLALAAGGRTYKLKFGHRGINHPVAENPLGRITVSVHNHGFAVAEEPLPTGAKISLRSLNDGCVEGLDYPELDAFSVQFHPEASPGPHDASDLFVRFRHLMEARLV